MPSSHIRVVLVEDDRSARDWMESGVRSDPGLELVASFGALRPALDWFVDHDADVLLTDLALPDGHGLSLVRDVAARVSVVGTPRTDVIVISIFGDEETVLQCIEAGAVGYLQKDSSRADIAKVIRDVRNGASPISPMIARGLLARFRAIGQHAASTAQPIEAVEKIPNALMPELTQAETEVLKLIARGHTYAEIASSRGVSVHTVQSQIKGLYGKLAVHSRGEAVFVAGQLGLIEPIARR